ncbi:MAG: hypothetical protein AAGI17_03585 [Planctomycetota bacterium]
MTTLPTLRCIGRCVGLGGLCVSVCLGLAAGVALAQSGQGFAQAELQPELQPEFQPELESTELDSYSLDPLDDPEEEHRVVLRAGGELSGFLVEQTPDVVVIRVDRRETRLAREDVISVTPLAPVAERYHERRLMVSLDDARSLTALAGWLRDRRAYRTALRDARAAVEADPFSVEAADMARWLTAQVAMIEASEKNRQRRKETEPEGEKRPDPEIEAAIERDRRLQQRRAGEFPTLSPDEINLIRVWEVDLTNPPRIMVADEVIDDLVEEYADRPGVPRTEEAIRQLKRAPSARVLDLMFRLRAQEFYSEVRVLDHPASLRIFRDDVHRRIVNACASAECHGGQQAGRLWLRRRQVNSDATVYTNFFILDKFKLRDGSPLIDYEDPEQSPLLQMAMRPTVSSRQHPQLGVGPGRNYRPLFDGPRDASFRRAVEWIRGMYQPRPDYAIRYEPPVPASLLVDENRTQKPGEPGPAGSPGRGPGGTQQSPGE